MSFNDEYQLATYELEYLTRAEIAAQSRVTKHEKSGEKTLIDILRLTSSRRKIFSRHGD